MGETARSGHGVGGWEPGETGAPHGELTDQARG